MPSSLRSCLAMDETLHLSGLSSFSVRMKIIQCLTYVFTDDLWKSLQTQGAMTPLHCPVGQVQPATLMYNQWLGGGKLGQPGGSWDQSPCDVSSQLRLPTPVGKSGFKFLKTM